MPTPNQARIAMMAAFSAGWNESVYPVSYDNAAYTPPTGVTSWAKFSIKFVGGGQISLGSTDNRRFRRWGFLTIEVYTMANTATSASDTLATTALNIFDGKDFSGVRFREGRIETVGEDAEGKWYEQDAVLYFEFDENK